MPIKPRDFERQMRRKFNFQPADSHSVDHIWLELQLEGIPTVLTKLSRNGDELRDRLIGKIARQLRVSTSYLREMVACTKSQAEYYELVRKTPFRPFGT